MNTITAFEFLSPQELVILDYLCEGWSRKDIADKLKVKKGTLGAYFGMIFAKLGIEKFHKKDLKEIKALMRKYKKQVEEDWEC